MSDTYTKLFSSITESTVWGESYATRIVWVAMLAMADARGNVYGSVPGLARRANVTLEEAEQALASFRSPDPYSRTKDHDGRRIADIDGGWNLVNHGKYGAVRNAEERKEAKRQWDREHRPSGHARAKQADASPSQSDESPTKSDESAPTSTSTITRKEQKPKQERSPSGSRLPPDWEPSEADIAFAQRERPDVNWHEEAAKFRDYWRAEPGAKARKLDWPGTWRNWIRRADRQRAGPHGQSATPSRQAQGVAAILGVNAHEFVADFAQANRALVRDPDSAGACEPVPAEPRRLSRG